MKYIFKKRAIFESPIFVDISNLMREDNILPYNKKWKIT